MDNAKEQERDALHKAIWAIADDLRGSVDGWDFKNYVLGAMFYRFISENITAFINKGEREAGDANFDYALISDSDAEGIRGKMVNTKGFFILPSELFENVRARAENDENLNETLEAVFAHIEESALGSASEKDLKGRPRLHHALAFLARHERRGGHRLLPRRHVPGRRGKENPKIPDRQQLHRHDHPASGESFLRHQHRHLHHGPEKRASPTAKRFSSTRRKNLSKSRTTTS